jgi:2-polyprenyl-6-hydroxyphenyl methylase/3-demethylubiquinone-9 3-methyltransferase
MENRDAGQKPPSSGEGWDHSTHREFYDYYANESQSPRTLERYGGIRDMVLRVYRREHPDQGSAGLRVADIGCGAGTQCLMWAELGHEVHGLDVNRPLVELAGRRAAERRLEARFEVGAASELPWDDSTFDICLVPELLEHVVDWKRCIEEFVRILRPGGLLFLSTTNRLCPRQQEFNLPAYSWYPSRLKRLYERLAVTTRPDLANYAKYPAVHWFSFYSLRERLDRLGLTSFDRFDVMDLANKGSLARAAVRAIRALPPVRWLGHVATPFTVVVAIKRRAQDSAGAESGG